MGHFFPRNPQCLTEAVRPACRAAVTRTTLAFSQNSRSTSLGAHIRRRRNGLQVAADTTTLRRDFKGGNGSLRVTRGILLPGRRACVSLIRPAKQLGPL